MLAYSPHDLKLVLRKREQPRQFIGIPYLTPNPLIHVLGGTEHLVVRQVYST